MRHEVADRWEVVTGPERMMALETPWKALWERAGDAYLTQSFAWCRTAWETVSRPLGRRLHLIAGWSGDELALVWPFVVYRHGVWRRARPLGTETAEYTGVLVEPGARASERIAHAWTMLLRTAHRDSILLPFVRSGTPLHRFLSGVPQPAYSEVTPLSSTRCDDDGDRAFVAHVVNGTTLRKHGRRLARMGDVVFERVADPRRRASIIAWTLRHKEAMLRRTGGKPLWDRTDLYQAFLAAYPHDEGLEAFALTLDGEPVATSIARVDHVRFEQFLSAYDPRYADYSPGQLLRARDMTWCMDRGLEYDLRVGDHGYKKDWTNRRGEAISYHVATSPWGALAMRLRALQRVARRTASDVGAGDPA